MNEKFLILRFSSFGDVTQCLTVPSQIKHHFPNADVHWVTRHDMAPLLENHPHIKSIWSFNKSQGILSLINLGLQLRKQNYTHVYDAHNNLRSRIISLCLIFKNHLFIRRSIRRWKRFLLFNFRINKFEMPFSGQRDLLEPLTPWGISKNPLPPPQIFTSSTLDSEAMEILKDFSGAIALAPSAAFSLKRWPKEYFQKLTVLFPSEKFVFLGGPEDQFIQDISQGRNCLNLAGKTSLKMSVAILKHCRLLIANDTGLLHVGEQLGLPTIALMGPAPFGFPCREKTIILERNLNCRPCSKHGQGPCINKTHHFCMVNITPEEVAAHIRNILKSNE